MPVPDVRLAIVIPAYKADFLARTLASIAAQTDQRFRVYIGDDASPEPLADLVGQCALPGGRLRYQRFDDRQGPVHLTRHWHRCVALSREPWVWLFSDDDMMAPNCVESFYAALDATAGRYDLYRFNTMTIDASDRPIGLNPPHPEVESWDRFAYFLLRQLRLTNQQELVFRRTAYDAIGGFLDLPLAWCSDHAFAIACGTTTGIFTMASGTVLFRQSGLNFSSRRTTATDRLKWRATAAYVTWLLEHVNRHARQVFPDRRELEHLARERFFFSLRALHRWIGLRDLMQFLPFVRDVLAIPVGPALARMLYYNVSALLTLARRPFAGRALTGPAGSGLQPALRRAQPGQ